MYHDVVVTGRDRKSSNMLHICLVYIFQNGSPLSIACPGHYGSRVRLGSPDKNLLPWDFKTLNPPESKTLNSYRQEHKEVAGNLFSSSFLA